MSDKGADIANEQAFRRAVLERLDRIIELLKPAAVTVNFQPWTSLPSEQPTTPMLRCASCGNYFRADSTHYCQGRPPGTAGGVVMSSFTPAPPVADSGGKGG